MNCRSMRMPTFIASIAIAFMMFARVASAQTELLPNMEPFAAADVQLVNGTAGLEVRFSATSWNRGLGPMELHGGELVGNDKQNVYQWVRRTDGLYNKYLVGTFEFHDEHNHFHFENYFLYELSPVDAPGGSGRTGQKTSFCLLDNVKVNAQITNGVRRAVYTTCNPDVQGISVGWGDRYGYTLPGQALPFAGNPSGDYLLKLTVDSKGNLHESDRSNNVSCALLRIDVNALSVQVIGNTCDTAPAVSVTDIAPPSVRAGSSAGVVITGSGFTSGMTVSFQNGSGKTPIASNVVVVNDTTITATISAQNGGSAADPVWDLRVGPAVLPSAFTVIR